MVCKAFFVGGGFYPEYGTFNSVFEHSTRVLVFTTHFMNSPNRYLTYFFHFRVSSNQEVVTHKLIIVFSNAMYGSFNSIAGVANSGIYLHHSFYVFTKARYPLLQIRVSLLFSDDS